MIIYKHENAYKELVKRRNKIKLYNKMLDKLKKKPNNEKTYLVNNNIYYLEQKIKKLESIS